jgi:hypothetical protein
MPLEDIFYALPLTGTSLGVETCLAQGSITNSCLFNHTRPVERSHRYVVTTDIFVGSTIHSFPASARNGIPKGDRDWIEVSRNIPTQEYLLGLS